MKTLTPEQRIEGFTELEGVLGEGGVGGAHLMSFLAGIAHAEKVLAEPKQDEEPLVYIRENEVLYINVMKANNFATEWKSNLGLTKEKGDVGLFLHPAPRKPFVRLTDEEITEIIGPYSMGTVGGYTRKLFDTIQDVLEEKNK